MPPAGMQAPESQAAATTPLESRLAEAHEAVQLPTADPAVASRPLDAPEAVLPRPSPATAAQGSLAHPLLDDPADGRGQTDDSAAGITTYNPFEGNRLGIADTPGVVAATIGDAEVAVTFADGAVRRFHHEWLRHCCYCAECGNPADGIRFTTVASVEEGIVAADAGAAGGDLAIAWPDGHRSVFGADWLIHYSYEPADAEARWSWRPITWRAGLAEELPGIVWADIEEGNAGHHRLLSLLCDYGIVRISDAGIDPEGIEEIAALLGPIHETSVYGRIFDVQTEAVSKLGSKTAMGQAPHTDDAMYYSQPGVVVFHCLANTAAGGTSSYADGFAIAEALAAEAPDAYEALTTLPVDHVRRHPGELDIRNRAPLISLDERGRVCGIRYFDRALAPLDVPADQVERQLRAIREYSRRMRSDEYTVRIQLRPGDAVLVDNHRVHHGRSAYDPAEPRRLRTCHVPRDEFHGRWRELARVHDPLSVNRRLPQGSATS